MGQNEEPRSEARVIPNSLYLMYSKLGGWLKFFVVLYIIAIPSFALALLPTIVDSMVTIPRLYQIGESFLANALIFALLSSVITLALLIAFVVMVFQKNRCFFTPLIILVLMDIPINVLMAIMSYKYPEFFSIGSSIFRFALEILFLGYFIKSVRVRTYMGTDEYLTKGPFSRLILLLFKPPVPEEPYRVVSEELYQAVYAGANEVQPTFNQVPVAPFPLPPPPAGWYPAPELPGHVRWWDGQAWVIESTRPQ